MKGEAAAWAEQPIELAVSIPGRPLRAAAGSFPLPALLAAASAAVLASQHAALAGALLVVLCGLNAAANPAALRPTQLLGGFAVGCVGFIMDANLGAGLFLGVGLLLWRLAAEARWSIANAGSPLARLEALAAGATAAGAILLDPDRTFAGLPLPEAGGLIGALLLAPGLLGLALCLGARLSSPPTPLTPFALACLIAPLPADGLVLLCALSAARLACTLQDRTAIAPGST